MPRKKWEQYTRCFREIPIIGVQKGGPQYSPAIVVYTLHSIVMILLYYIYLAVVHFVLMAILNTCNIFYQTFTMVCRYVYVVCYIHCTILAGE